MRYRVISADTLDGLEEAVNLALAHGWQLWEGLLAVARPPMDVPRSGTAYLYLQAMTRADEEPIGTDAFLA